MLERIARLPRLTPLRDFPPSTSIAKDIHRVGDGIYLVTSFRDSGAVRAVGWAESDYWACRAWELPFLGDVVFAPSATSRPPSLTFAGRPDDLSFESIVEHERARRGRRELTDVTGVYRMTDGAFLYVELRGTDGITYLFGSTSPQASDSPNAVAFQLPPSSLA
jgi:hypothetical protein